MLEIGEIINLKEYIINHENFHRIALNLAIQAIKFTLNGNILPFTYEYTSISQEAYSFINAYKILLDKSFKIVYNSFLSVLIQREDVLF